VYVFYCIALPLLAFTFFVGHWSRNSFISEELYPDHQSIWYDSKFYYNFIRILLGFWVDLIYCP